jgi:ankyrin repeat protein
MIAYKKYVHVKHTYKKYKMITRLVWKDPSYATDMSFIEIPIKPNRVSSHEFSTAVWTDDFKTVEKYIQEKGPINARTRSGDTELMFACRRGNYDMVELLLNNGADPNIANDNNKTALFYSSELGYDKISKLLLTRGAGMTINLQSRIDLDTPLTCRLNFRSEKIMNSTGGYVKDTMYEAVKTLLEYGADVYVVSPEKRNLLMHGVYPNVPIKVVQLLLDSGMRECINYQDRDGDTALMTAIRSGYFDAVKLLLDNGADMYIKSKYITWRETVYSALILARCSYYEQRDPRILELIEKTLENDINLINRIFPDIVTMEILDVHVKSGLDGNV